MFIVTARLPKKRLLTVGTILLCLCAVLLGWRSAPDSAAASAPAELRGVRDNEDRIHFLQSLGWEVSDQPVLEEELLIPEEFDHSYTDYLALQTGQGFDLTQYCGKRVTRYTYEITNYPTGQEGVQVSILIYKNRVIGGEVVSPTADGFLHGLNRPE